jgi:cyclase
MKRPLVLGTIVVTGLLAITVFGQQPPAAPIDSIEKLTDNLYRIPGQGGNSAVFVRGDGVLLVDTKLKDNGQALLDQIKKVTDKPITHIVNTHTHGDHTGSNMFFPAAVEVVVHENTKANMEKMPAFQDDKGKVGLPDRTYTDKMTLFSGKDAVDLYYFGPAHTNGDTFVVFRNARVMHSGDAFARKSQPFIDPNNGGSGVAYGETIGKAAAGIKNIDKVITGHGDVMGWQDFVDYGEFNRLFVAHAKASIAAGKTPEQALAEFKLPEKFTGYDLASTRGGPAGNFNVIYGELRK